MVNILVVEDDKIQRENLVKILKEVDENLEIYEADNKDDAIEISKKVKINFFFIDMMLKNSTGINLARELREIKGYKLTWIIFITTFVDYMLQAFREVHCYDYILKPYKKEKIQDIARLLIEDKYSKEDEKEIEEKYVVFKNQGIMVKIYLKDIFFIEIRIGKTIIHTKLGIYKMVRLPLKKVLNMIEEDYIIQTHKAYLVNVNYIERIEKISRGCFEIRFYNYDDTAFLTTTYKENLKNFMIKE